MKTLTTICALIAVPLVAFAGDDAAKKAPAAGAPAPVKQAEPPPMAAPTPAKELDTAKGYAKAWSCSGTNMGGEKVTAKLTWKLDLDKFWYSVRMDEPKSKAMPAFTGTGFIGIDAVSKAWVFEGFDNHGGNIHLKAAVAAVTADQAVFEGDASDSMGKAPTKFTFKMDAKTKHMSFVGEFGGKKAFDFDCK